MKKEVWLKIKGTQKVDTEFDETEIYTQGLYYLKNDTFYITYKETETTGFEGCTSVIKVKPNKVSLVRQGNARTNMVIEERQRNVGYYSTPMGELIVGITGKNIENNLDENGGKVFFAYSLDVNSQFISENTITVEVLTSNNIEI